MNRSEQTLRYTLHMLAFSSCRSSSPCTELTRCAMLIQNKQEARLLPQSSSATDAFLWVYTIWKLDNKAQMMVLLVTLIRDTPQHLWPTVFAWKGTPVSRSSPAIPFRNHFLRLGLFCCGCLSKNENRNENQKKKKKKKSDSTWLSWFPHQGADFRHSVCSF